MRIGLLGTEHSADLCVLKREIEDRGHDARFVNLRSMPQYVLSSMVGDSIAFDHCDLGDFDAFWLGELESRNRFFRGYFGKDIWVSLQERYTEFTRSETENLTFQLSLLLVLGHLRRVVNKPSAFIACRLRPSVLFTLSRAGIPTVRASIGLHGEPQDREAATRIRLEEDYFCDVPCFPRTLEGCIGLKTEPAAEAWRILAVRECRPHRMILWREGSERGADQPGEAAELSAAVLDTLDLEIAEIRIKADGRTMRIADVSPAPRFSDFDRILGPDLTGSVARRLTATGGEN
jgi:hypothetical protein